MSDEDEGDKVARDECLVFESFLEVDEVLLDVVELVVVVLVVVEDGGGGADGGGVDDEFDGDSDDEEDEEEEEEDSAPFTTFVNFGEFVPLTDVTLLNIFIYVVCFFCFKNEKFCL